MNILVVSSKYPPEYSGSGLRAHNTYLRLKNKYDLNVKVLCSSILENSNKTYIIDDIIVHQIANKRNYWNSDHAKINFLWSMVTRFSHKIITAVNYMSEAIPAFLFLIKNYLWMDIIHVYGNVNVTSAAITFSKVTKMPVFIELVNLVEKPKHYEPGLLSLIYGKGFPKHSTIVAISKALSDACIRIGVDENMVWCRPNPIDEEKFNLFPVSNYGQYVNNKSFKKESKIILHLAKFLQRKKQDFMIEVLARLPRNYVLILAGPLVNDGPLGKRDSSYYQLIVESIKEHELEDRVILISDFIVYPQELIKMADVFVLPSTMEGLGTPILEAIASGIPVVTSDIPGVFDQWVHEGINGYICKLDSELWAKRIIDATQISKESMQKASEQILSVASTRVIDAEYFRRFKNILN